MAEKVALVGSGLIGRGWAVVFGRAGHDVALYDPRPEAVDDALATIELFLADMAGMGLVDDPAAVRQRITGARSLEEALDGALYVQENAPEDVAVKESIFLAMDRVAVPEAVLASSCSSIPPARFMERVGGRERCIIAHPFNPPHMIPVVEIVPSPWTSEATFERCWAMMEAVGQSPVRINEPVVGFVVNRLQAAVVNEAIYLVGRGVVSPRDLDRCMKDGLGRRWGFIGPFETMELNAPGGFIDYATKFGWVYEAIGRDLGVAAPWKREALESIEAWRRSVLPRERIAERQHWRNRNLMRMAKVFHRTSDAEED